jgi:transposase, IS30 family
MSHLTVEQRYTISILKQEGYKQIEIARRLGKHKSVISRELRRNCDKRNGSYKADLAHRKYQERKESKPVRCGLSEQMKLRIEKELARKLSPEQISGLCKREGVAMASHETIYDYIWRDKQAGGKLYEHLRRRGRRYRRRGALKDNRGIIKDRVGIEERPAIVEQKSRLGDLEIDTIIGKDHKGAILTVNDRVTGMLKMRKLSGKNAEELAKVAVEALTEWQPFIHTITADNGKEFAAHKFIAEQLNVQVFFAKPYHSWQRGSNENLNGLIRQYIPKKTDFDNVSEEYIAFVEKELNERPRKRLEFQTPSQVFNQMKVAFTT